MKNGILLIDKPQGFTSHDVVAKTRGILKMKKIGHSGTLDPLATGVLPLFLGYATKATDRMPNHDKAYTATLKLGITTDTQDSSGKVLSTTAVIANKAEVEVVLNSFLGDSQQLPPMYSAVQVNGQRLYDLARKGLEVQRDSRKITVYTINLLNFNENTGEYSFNISCSKGTYVRTICHDIGEKLGCGATLTALRRTNSSGFVASDCISLEQLEEVVKTDSLNQYILPVDTVFKRYEKIVLNTELTKYFCNGVPLWLRQLDVQPNNQMVRLYTAENQFLGIAKADRDKKQLTNQQQFIGEVPY